MTQTISETAKTAGILSITIAPSAPTGLGEQILSHRIAVVKNSMPIVTDRTSERGKMTLDAAITNLRRSLDTINETPIRVTPQSKLGLLKLQSEAVIREYDRMKANERELVYQLPTQLP